MSRGQEELRNTEELPPLVGVEKVAQFILKERPNYIAIPDVHMISEPQDISAALLQAIHSQPNYKPGDVGFYVEALFDTARPEQGDYSGSVVLWDDWHNDPKKGTRYRDAIATSVQLKIPVHGLDLEKKVDAESLERTNHWLTQLQNGHEPIKVLLIGAGHVWNDTRRTADIISRIEGKIMILKNVEAYSAPKFHATADVDLALPQITNRKFRLNVYESSLKV